jgi:LmbE family N-acetylglucosaminyl deacetylase
MSFTATHDTVSNRPNHSTIGDLVDRLDSPRPVLVAVWAHPDDESLLGAGLIGEVTRRGGRVINVSATLGEHGTADARLNPPTALAARRHWELKAALNTLGVEESITLGYADGGCDQVPTSIGARRVSSTIDDVEPDAVLTFGDDGVTGHPDHRAVARWTKSALAERPRQIPLIASAAGAAWHETLVERMHEVGAFWPGSPARILDGPVWSVRLDGEHLEQKLRALACHRSQMGPLQGALGATGYRTLASVVAYRPGNPAAQHLLARRRWPAAA